jgi:hypothetical protein
MMLSAAATGLTSPPGCMCQRHAHLAELRVDVSVLTGSDENANVGGRFRYICDVMDTGSLKRRRIDPTIIWIWTSKKSEGTRRATSITTWTLAYLAAATGNLTNRGVRQ